MPGTGVRAVEALPARTGHQGPVRGCPISDFWPYRCFLQMVSIMCFSRFNLRWIQTNPLVFWYQWEYLRSPAKFFFRGI